jgi:hypothetical protein
MYKALQTSGPAVYQIHPPGAGNSVVLESLTVDIERTGSEDSVRLYFVDKQDRYLIYKASAKDTSLHVDANIRIEGWKGASLEIEINGFGRTFAGVSYKIQNVGNPKSKCIDDNAIVRMYKIQTKEVKS